MLKIIELKSENVKRLRAVTIKPDGTLVIIGGRNAQGKTSVLDSIAMALGGKDEVPAVPIRTGEQKASTVVDLGDMIVRRTFTAAGSTLTIEDREKKRFPSPQALLDSLTGRLTFDPLSFLTLKPAAQLEALQDLVGLDTTADDREKAGHYTERTVVNREVERAQHSFTAAPHYPAVTAQVDVTVLTTERLEAAVHNDGRTVLQTDLSSADNQFRIAQQSLAHNTEAINDLEAQLAAIQARLANARENRKALEATVTKATTAKEAAAKAVADFKVIDMLGIDESLKTAQEANRQFEANRVRQTLGATLAAKQKESAALTTKIEQIDQRKEKKLAAAKFPVAGLSFGAGEVLFNGLPFAQASDAERMRVSVGMAAAMNPKVRVALVRNGSLLDQENLALLAKLAEEHDLQVWIERVGTGDPSAVIIEDGQVMSHNSPSNEEAKLNMPATAPTGELAL